jgi:glucokinase
MILAGDIGGTNSRMAFFEGDPNHPQLKVLEVFPSKGRAGLEEILQEFIAKHPHAVAAAAFGIAGPVRNGRCETPNLPWIVDSASLAACLGLKSASLLNDLEANAHGIAVLGDDDLATLSSGAPGAAGNQVLISAGTGLGEAGLIAMGGRYLPYASEGGHGDFAPRNETEIDLLRYLQKRFEHVSCERVLSGPGLFNIYQFLRDTGRGEEPAWLTEEFKQKDPGQVVSGNGLKGSSQICVDALDLFVSIYGAEAGNLALKGMATGGVYIGGGIAPRILAKLKEPVFLNSFRAKGRVSKVLDAIPVKVILNDKTALLGAGRVALLAEAEG